MNNKVDKQYKLQKDLVKGDVIRVEFGDYDNWVTVVIDSVEVKGNKMLDCCIHCHYKDGREEEMWGSANNEVEVIGREKND